MKCFFDRWKIVQNVILINNFVYILIFFKWFDDFKWLCWKFKIPLCAWRNTIPLYIVSNELGYVTIEENTQLCHVNQVAWNLFMKSSQKVVLKKNKMQNECGKNELNKDEAWLQLVYLSSVLSSQNAKFCFLLNQTADFSNSCSLWRCPIFAFVMLVVTILRL